MSSALSIRISFWISFRYLLIAISGVAGNRFSAASAPSCLCFHLYGSSRFLIGSITQCSLSKVCSVPKVNSMSSALSIRISFWVSFWYLLIVNFGTVVIFFFGFVIGRSRRLPKLGSISGLPKLGSISGLPKLGSISAIKQCCWVVGMLLEPTWLLDPSWRRYHIKKINFFKGVI